MVVLLHVEVIVGGAAVPECIILRSVSINRAAFCWLDFTVNLSVSVCELLLLFSSIKVSSLLSSLGVSRFFLGELVSHTTYTPFYN